MEIKIKAEELLAAIDLAKKAYHGEEIVIEIEAVQKEFYGKSFLDRLREHNTNMSYYRLGLEHGRKERSDTEFFNHLYSTF